jgi:hypothetical protein
MCVHSVLLARHERGVRGWGAWLRRTRMQWPVAGPGRHSEHKGGGVAARVGGGRAWGSFFFSLLEGVRLAGGRMGGLSWCGRVRCVGWLQGGFMTISGGLIATHERPPPPRHGCRRHDNSITHAPSLPQRDGGESQMHKIENKATAAASNVPPPNSREMVGPRKEGTAKWRGRGVTRRRGFPRRGRRAGGGEKGGALRGARGGAQWRFPTPRASSLLV